MERQIGPGDNVTHELPFRLKKKMFEVQIQYICNIDFILFETPKIQCRYTLKKENGCFFFKNPNNRIHFEIRFLNQGAYGVPNFLNYLKSFFLSFVIRASGSRKAGNIIVGEELKKIVLSLNAREKVSKL